MADGDVQRYAQIASLAAFTVAGLSFIAWLLRLSALVKLISDSILVGFKAGAGLTIAMTQLPSLFGVAGGGHNFFERAVLFVGQIGQTSFVVLTVGIAAIGLIVLGDRLLPGKPVALVVVTLAITAATALGLPALGVPTTGEIPAGLPSLSGPDLRLRDVEGIIPLAAGCLLLAYIEGVSAARTFAAKHGYALDPRQELLGISAANLAAATGQGYPVAGGLSQSAVNDKAGARSPLALVFASITLALCLLFLTGLLENLPKAVLAAIVLTAVYGLLDFPAMLRMWRMSRLDFYAATIALVAVLLLGILHGILLAALASILLLLARVSRPHVAFLGRIPGTDTYSDRERHPENEPIPGVIAFRPEASVIYVNAEAILETVLKHLDEADPSVIRLVVCDLSAAPYLDLAGSRMLHDLHSDLAGRNIAFRIVGAHGSLRDLLRADGVDAKVEGLARTVTLDSLLRPSSTG
jgi:MFS superfamily sulfate permease-like transporter